MTLQENHDVLHAALLLPRLHNATRAHFADPINLQNPQRLFGQNSQGIEAERRNQALRVSSANALDQTGAEISLDPFNGRRIDLFPMIDLKLQTIARMA